MGFAKSSSPWDVMFPGEFEGTLLGKQGKVLFFVCLIRVGSSPCYLLPQGHFIQD